MRPSIVDRPQTPFPILTDFTGRTREQRLGSPATVKRIVEVAAGSSSVLCCWW